MKSIFWFFNVFLVFFVLFLGISNLTFSNSAYNYSLYLQEKNVIKGVNNIYDKQDFVNYNDIVKYDNAQTLMINSDYFFGNYSYKDFSFLLGFNLVDSTIPNVDYTSWGGFLLYFIESHHSQINNMNLGISSNTSFNNNAPLYWFTNSNENYFFSFDFSSIVPKLHFVYSDILSGYNYRYTFNLDLLFLDSFFQPLILNQSSSNFNLNYFFISSVFESFDYSQFHPILQRSKISDSSIVDVIDFDNTQFINSVQLFTRDYFFNMFSVSKTHSIYFNNTDSSFVKPVRFSNSFLVKNGFELYPSSYYLSYVNSNTVAGDNVFVNLNFYDFSSISGNQYFYYGLGKNNFTWNLALPSHNDSNSVLNINDFSSDFKFNLFTFDYDIDLTTSPFSFSIYFMNFSLFNWQDWNNDFNGGSIWQIPYQSCGITHLLGCIENGAIWIVNNVPGIDYVFKFFTGVINTLNDTNELWNSISNLFAFNTAFQMLIGGVIVLALFYGVMLYV